MTRPPARAVRLDRKAENKGRCYHDGRFPTLLDVVKSYNDRFGLTLTEEEGRDVVEYLKSL